MNLTGFVTEELKSRILSESWALINTSIREALPVSFLESLAHKTPIISGENPDDLTRRFGYHVTSDNFTSALRRMVRDPERSRKGEHGRSHVKKIHSLDKVIDMHIEVYENVLEG